MDRTKIPKPSQLKLPKIIVTNSSNPQPLVNSGSEIADVGAPRRKVLLARTNSALETIPESKVNVRGVASTQKNPVTSFPKPMLRRRSKSASDLRLAGKPRFAFSEEKKVIVATKAAPKTTTVARKPVPPTRPTKRSADKDSNDEVKPKVGKMKIAEWDYKSKFNLLKEKHTLLKQKLKEAEERLSDLATVEEDLNNFKSETANLKTKVDSLTETRESMSTSIFRLTAETVDLRGKLTSLTDDHAALSDQHRALQLAHDALLEDAKTTRAKSAALQTKLDALTSAHRTLTADHENLTGSHNLLRLDFDTQCRENELLEHKLQDALVKIERLEGETTEQKGEIISNEALRRQLHNTIQDLKGNIRVFCRVRPPVTAGEFDQLQCYINYTDECCIEIRKCRESMSVSGKPTDCKLDFTFDHVFPAESTQEEVFGELAQLVQSALDGYHVCVFAYGQTGSGKTFTMQGGAPDQLGMIPRSIDLIFDTIEKLKKFGWHYTVQTSFLEIYNEAIKDLLDPNSKYSYDIRFNEGKGTTVTNLRIETIRSASHLKTLMTTALQNRAVAATNFNEHSSRSHAVTKIYLQGVNSISNVCYVGSVNLVDLAGSESAKTSSHERLLETKNINKSLSTLGGVMLALHNRDPHVPYRNSKLTYLLQSCLGGNSKTLMFVNISPFDECYNESVNSLRFASKVKEVKTGSRRNKNYIVGAGAACK